MRNRNIALTGLLCAAALILGFVDSLLPVSGLLPGVKLGLGNLAVVFALYRLGCGRAAVVSGSKVLLSALMFGGFSGFVYSISGAALSFLVMLPISRSKRFGPVGASAAGGAAHIAAQIAVAAAVTQTAQVLSLIPPLAAIGTLTGALLGLIAALVINRLDASALSGKAVR